MKALRLIALLCCLATIATAQNWPQSRGATPPSSMGTCPTWAHPAVFDGHLLIKDIGHLYLWSTE
jgi:hypothetical protein